MSNIGKGQLVENAWYAKCCGEPHLSSGFGFRVWGCCPDSIKHVRQEGLIHHLPNALWYMHRITSRNTVANPCEVRVRNMTTSVASCDEHARGWCLRLLDSLEPAPSLLKIDQSMHHSLFSLKIVQTTTMWMDDARWEHDCHQP